MVLVLNRSNVIAINRQIKVGFHKADDAGVTHVRDVSKIQGNFPGEMF